MDGEMAYMTVVERRVASYYSSARPIHIGYQMHLPGLHGITLSILLPNLRLQKVSGWLLAVYMLECTHHADGRP